MASTIRLCYGPMPANHPRLASGTIGLASRPSRVHLGLNRPSHFLSNCSKNYQVARPVWRVNCLKNGMNVPGMPGNIGRLMGGARALDLLMEMLKCASDDPRRPLLPDKELEVDLKKWKSYAKGLSKSGNPQTALHFLDEERKKFKDKKWSETERSLRMASIELLIFQKNYEKADERLDQEIDDKQKVSEEEKISRLEDDPFEISKQIILYKAIVRTMLEGKSAAKWWIAFVNTLN